MPTRRRISCRFSFVTGRPLTATDAGAGGEDAVEVQHQRGLAGAVGPEQGDPLARVDVQVDAEQRLVAVGVGVGEAADVEDGGHGSLAAASRCSRATASRGAPARRARRSG